MTLSAWRITKQKHAKSAFSGEGARIYGGRWNSPGTPIIYTAQSQALAVLEVLVHLDSPELLKRYSLFEVEMDLFYAEEFDVIQPAEKLEGQSSAGRSAGDRRRLGRQPALRRITRAERPGSS